MALSCPGNSDLKRSYIDARLDGQAMVPDRHFDRRSTRMPRGIRNPVLIGHACGFGFPKIRRQARTGSVRLCGLRSNPFLALRPVLTAPERTIVHSQVAAVPHHTGKEI
jgi:hypothetical protein